MMKNTKGMSAVVTTLIIILLTIVALGIIWVVVRNVIQGGSEQVEWAQKCQPIEIQAVAVNMTDSQTGAFANESYTTYSVTLSRTNAGEAISGVKLVFSNGTAYSDVVEFNIPLGALQTKTNSSINLTDTTVKDADQLEITPYFIDDLGETHLCERVTEEF